MFTLPVIAGMRDISTLPLTPTLPVMAGSVVIATMLPKTATLPVTLTLPVIEGKVVIPVMLPTTVTFALPVVTQGVVP
jgi:hypothetical protein